MTLTYFGWRSLGPKLYVPALLIAVVTSGGCSSKTAKAPESAAAVEVVDAIRQDVPVYEEWVAQLNGNTNAQITPKVQGYLLRQAYRDGSFVRRGELLFEVDPRPFQAALDQVKAQFAVAQANLAKATTDVQRDRPLAAQNAIPQKQLDTDLANEAAGTATVQAAKAQVEQAELNLQWTNMYSPIDGIAGKADSQVGDLVGMTTKMATVSKVDPIRAYFAISESTYLQRAASITQVVRGQKRERNQVIDVQFIQADGIPYPSKGRITLVNRDVSSQTGTIQIAAEFPNNNAILRPGGFGRVRIQTGLDKNVLVVPQRAVIEVQSMYQVVVVKDDNTVAFRPVKLGQRVGSNYVITEGLQLGEKVVAQGFMKLKDGMPVTPKAYSVAQAQGN